MLYPPLGSSHLSHHVAWTSLTKGKKSFTQDPPRIQVNGNCVNEARWRTTQRSTRPECTGQTEEIRAGRTTPEFPVRQPRVWVERRVSPAPRGLRGDVFLAKGQHRLHYQTATAMFLRPLTDARLRTSHRLRGLVARRKVLVVASGKH